jgi:hypothetical protein
LSPNEVTGELTRVPTYFRLLSLHHRTLRDTVRVQHPRQRPLPFRYVIAVVSSIADALAAAAAVGVVHLDMNEDNVMVDDPEAMDFEAEQLAADATVVDYRQCIRRFEEPPEAVVVGWETVMHFDDEWVVRVPVVDGRLMPPDDAMSWGNPAHTSPELQVEWKRTSDELERAKAAVVQAYQVKAAAVQGASSVCLARGKCFVNVCGPRCLLLCRRQRG